MLRSGLVSVTFRKLEPHEIVALVAKAGLAGIEWGGDIHVPHGQLETAREVRAMTEQAGLVTVAYGSYFRVGEPNEGLHFESVIATALALDAATIRVWAGRQSSENASAKYRDRIVSELRRLCDLAVRAGCTISLEFHSGTLTDTNESAERLLESVGHSAVQCYWQPPLGTSAEYRLAGLRSIMPWLSNVHVYHWEGRERRPLADGEAQWCPWISKIAASGKDHNFLLEFVRQDDPDQFLADARALEEWLRGAGA